MADVFRVGDWLVEPQLNSISANGNTIRVEPKIMQVLVCLAERANQVVSKERLIQSVWTDAFVSDDVLTRSISELRRVFGDDPRESRFIQTIPKSGYRLIAPVSFEGANREAVSPESVADGDETRRDNPRWPYARLLAACLILLVGMAALAFYLWGLRKSEASGGAKPMRSIAVLPIKSVGPGVGDEYLGLQIADTLITRLSGTKQLVVRPLGAVRKYTDPDHDPMAAGRELSVDLVLDGSTTRIGDRIRVTVRLLKVTDGSALFAEKYDEKFAGIFGIQDSIAAQVAAALSLKLTSEERRLLRRHSTENTEAYHLYVMGRYFAQKGTVEGYNKGIEYFNQALKTDSGYALAYSGLADSYFGLAAKGYLLPRQGYLKSKEAALKALEIDSSLAEPHHSLAAFKMAVEYDWIGAEAEYRRSIELDPASYPYHSRAKVLWYQGRHDEAMAQVKRSLDLDPADLDANTSLGAALFWAHRYDEAIEQFQKMLEMDPNNADAHFNIGITYQQKRMYQEAIAEIQRAIGLVGDDDPEANALLAEVYAVSGKRAEATKALEQLKEQSKQRYVDPYAIAVIYTGLGEKDYAFEELEKGYDYRSFGMIWLKVDPRLDPLRSDPRFMDLLRRVGLGQ